MWMSALEIHPTAYESKVKLHFVIKIPIKLHDLKAILHLNSDVLPSLGSKILASPVLNA